MDEANLEKASSENAKNTAKKTGKNVLNKFKNRILKNYFFRKIIIIIAIVSIILIFLASAVKMIFYIDTAGGESGDSGDSGTKARVPAAFQDITQSAGVSTSTKSTKSTSSSSGGDVNSRITNIDNSGTEEEQISKRIIACAQACHQYLRENGYIYGGGMLIPDGVYEGKEIDCTSYVSWVMYTAGYDSFKAWQEIDIVANASKHGLIEVPLTDVRAGDIIHEDGHVEIVAEVVGGTITRVYNCGSDKSIQDSGTAELPESTPDYGGADHVLRPKNLGGAIHQINGASTQNYASSGNSVSNSSGNNGTGVQSSTNVSGHIVSNNRGGYKVDIDLDKKVDDVIAQLDEEGNNPLRNYLSDKNRKEYLKAFLRASIVTSYPDLRKKSEIGQAVPDDEIQGIIKIRRKTESTPDDNPGEYLQYIPENQYNQLKQNSDNSIFNFFTIDNSGQIVVAGYEKRTAQPQSENKGGDPRPDDVSNQAESDMYQITDARINYTQQVERYIMPFDLLWSLLVYSSDEDFTYDLAKLVTNGEIIITVCDNITQRDKTDVYTYDKNVKIKEYATFNDTTQSPPKVASKTYSGDRPDEKYTYTITNKSNYESNTPSISVTYADTWTMKYEAKVQKKNDTNTNTTNTTEPDDANFKDNGEENISQSGSDSLLSGWKKEYEDDLKEAYKDDIQKRNDEIQAQKNEKEKETAETSNGRQASSSNKQQNQEELKPFEVKYSIEDLKLKYSSKYTNKKRNVTTVTTEKKYIVQPGNTEGKDDPKDTNDNFVKLLKKHGKAYGSLESDKEWLFESMEAQESICDMEDLIKYLFQKTYNIDLGVDDFDFDEYGTVKFNSVYGGDVGDVLVHWICSFENENLWDFMYENGEYNALYVKTHVTPDRKNYKMRADAGASTANNRNFGFGVCFYSNGNYMHTEAFRKYGIDITDSKYQQEGSLLDTEIVDKVRDEKIRADVETLRERATREGVTLDDAQIAVLVDISYQWGNIGNFFDVYKAAGQDRKNTAIRNMQAYDSSGNLGGHPLDGVEYVNRENCRWKLFSEGIWVTNNGKTLTPGTTSSGANYSGDMTSTVDSSGDRIVQDAKTGKKYRVFCQGNYGGAIPSSGCSISSEAIVLSAYRPDLKYTPDDMARLCNYNYPRSLDQIAGDLSNLNVPSTAYSIRPPIGQEISENVKQEAIKNIGDNLSQRKPVIILVTDSRKFGSKYTGNAHYMALVGFNSQGKPVIADPAHGGKVWEEDSLEDLVRYAIYEPTYSGAERGYVLIK